jgi:CheY-like chemotaxis protein
VDDNTTNLQLLHETLDGLGYKLLIAKNGPTALRIAQKAGPSLILLDIMMPEMDGYEVCRRLKADSQTSKIPVIFITALADEEDEAKGLGLGAVDYITKPVNPELVRAGCTITWSSNAIRTTSRRWWPNARADWP